MECGPSKTCVGMVRSGEIALVFYHDCIWQYNLRTRKWHKKKEAGWRDLKAVVEWNGFAYAFYTNGIWKTSLDGNWEKVGDNYNWKGICKNSIVNFGPDCYVHHGKHIFYVNLRNG